MEYGNFLFHSKNRDTFFYEIYFQLRRVKGLWVRVMVFNTTFNNISVISWRSALLVEATRIPGENHRNAASHWQTLSHNVVSSTAVHPTF